MMIELSFEVLGWWLALTIGASLLSAFAYPLVCRCIEELGALKRSLVRWVYVAWAPVAAALSVVLVTQPTLAGFFVPAHCHANQCGAHAPVYAHDSLMLIGLAAASSLAVLLLMLMLLWALRRAHQQFRTLSFLTSRALEGYRTLDSEDVVACCVGFWKPEILLSRGLVKQLQPDELVVVLAHEHAHAERLDNLRALLLRWLTVFWPAYMRTRINKDNRMDAEQACDLVAARTVAAPEQVASVIRKLSALYTSPTTNNSACRVGFDGDAPAARVHALEHCHNNESPSFGGWLKTIACLSLNGCVQIYVLTSVSHELIEWLGYVGI